MGLCEHSAECAGSGYRRQLWWGATVASITVAGLARCRRRELVPHNSSAFGCVLTVYATNFTVHVNLPTSTFTLVIRDGVFPSLRLNLPG